MTGQPTRYPKPPRRKSLLSYIKPALKIEDLSPSCYTDGSVCGNIFTDSCLLTEVVRLGGVIRSC